MHKLTHYRLCPLSRSIRLALIELGILFEMLEEKPWEWRPAFLALNPAGDLPVLELQDGPVLCGAYAISEYVNDEVRKHPADGGSVPLFPGNREERAEVRRLVDWCHHKLQREVTRELLEEKVYRRFQPGREGPPDVEVLRAVRANLRYHLTYIAYLADQRRYLAGEQLSFADMAAAAHLSVIDYLGEVPWADHPAAKEWYARIKSRPAFQPLLGDRIPGAPPPAHYADLDF
jgi:glutathione S-transferase